MHPEAVWVIFNNVNNTILFVYSEKYLGQQKLNWLHNDSTAPNYGTTPNRDKLVLITLAAALQIINISYSQQYADDI